MQRKRSFIRRALGSVFAVGLITAGGLVGTLPAGAVTPVAKYSALPGVIPGNVASQAFEATQTSEFGDAVALAPGAGYLNSARVLMSSWGCESGSWNLNNCSTTPGSTFAVPITFKLYTEVGGEPGALITSNTQTFNIPFRPSADNVNCTGVNAGKWYSVSEATCFNGLATPITFDFSQSPLVVSGNVVWTVAYNTTHYGYTPVGESALCYTSSGGCGYDSLNVGTDGAPLPNAGTDLDIDGAILNSATAGQYCDGGAGGTGTLRHDTSAGCWAGYRPAGEINVVAAVAIPQITTAPVVVAEGNSGPHTVNVPVTLSAPSTNTVTVKWRTRYQTALPPADYTTASGIVTFAPGEYSKLVPITVQGDTTLENNEQFAVDFTLPTNATLSPPGLKITSQVTLLNDDRPALKLTNVNTTEGAAANLTLSLSQPYNAPITVTLNSSNVTAIAPGDYTALVNTQVTFPAGSVGPILVPVTVPQDGVLGESQERFTVTGSSPSVIASVTRIVYIAANNT